MLYKIGDVVDLQNETTIGVVPRLAEVIETHDNFVICKSIAGGYKECINLGGLTKNYKVPNVGQESIAHSLAL